MGDDHTWVTAFNAALNVVQTCFLAYLAARYGGGWGNGRHRPSQRPKNGSERTD